MSFLFLFVSDPVAIWTLVVGIATLLVAIVGVWATIHFSSKAPTVDDLARVEEHVSHLAEVRSGIASLVRRQEDADALTARARQVDIMVSGETESGDSLRVLLASAAAGVSFSRIELLTELGTSFGTVRCWGEEKNPVRCSATISFGQLNDWMNGGTPTSSGVRLVLRIWMLFDTQTAEAYRDMAVILSYRSEQIDDGRGRVRRTYRKIQGLI